MPIKRNPLRRLMQKYAVKHGICSHCFTHYAEENRVQCKVCLNTSRRKHRARTLRRKQKRLEQSIAEDRKLRKRKKMTKTQRMIKANEELDKQLRGL
jgi:hypothetical protein